MRRETFPHLPSCDISYTVSGVIKRRPRPPAGAAQHLIPDPQSKTKLIQEVA